MTYAEKCDEEQRLLVYLEKLKNENISLLPPPELPEGKYNVIYADPPWQYQFSETDTRKIENHYPTVFVIIPIGQAFFASFLLPSFVIVAI